MPSQAPESLATGQETLADFLREDIGVLHSEVKRLCSEPARSAGSRGRGLVSDTALRPLPLCHHLSDRVGEGCRLHGFSQKGINAQDCRVLGVYKRTVARAQDDRN